MSQSFWTNLEFSAIVYWQLLFCSNIIIPFFPSRNKSAGGIISIKVRKIQLDHIRFAKSPLNF